MLIELSNCERKRLIAMVSAALIDMADRFTADDHDMFTVIIGKLLYTPTKEENAAGQQEAAPPPEKKRPGRKPGTSSKKSLNTTGNESSEPPSTPGNTQKSTEQAQSESNGTETTSNSDDNFFDPEDPSHKALLADELGKFDGPPEDKALLREHWKRFTHTDPVIASPAGLQDAFRRCIESAKERMTEQ